MKRAVIAAAVIATGIIIYVNKEEPVAVKEPMKSAVTKVERIGCINLELMGKNEEIEALKAKARRLRLEIEDLKGPMLVGAPNVGSEAFEASAWQKNAQALIGEKAEIETKQLKAAEEYRHKTEEAYLKRRDKVNAEYLNAILNIRLKLENAEVMRLSEEEIEGYEGELERLQSERGSRQIELEREWVKEIEEAAKAAVSGEEEALRLKARTLMEQEKETALRKHEEVQVRNEDLMAKAMQLSMKRQDRRRDLEQELSEVEKEIRVKEEAEVEKLSEMVSKVALIRGIETVFIKREEELELGERKMRTNMIATKQTVDITSDVEREMKR